MRTRKKIALLIFILSLGLIFLPIVVPADLLGGYWEQPECWVDYNYYYCDWFPVGELNIVNGTTYAKPEFAMCPDYYGWPRECEFILCEKVADMESLGGDILTYCRPPEEACIKEWAGAFCPAAIYHGRMKYLQLIGAVLFFSSFFIWDWSVKQEEKTE